MAKKSTVSEDKKLTGKQKPFAELYLQTKNGAKSIILAGYKVKNNDPAIAAALAYENLRKPHIAKYIRDRMEAQVMETNEALWNLSKLAQIVDVADYISFRDVYTPSKNEDTEPYLTGVIADFDIKRFKDDGFGHLIKAIKNTSNGRPNILLRDPESANVWIGKSGGAFIDKVEVKDTTIRVKINRPPKK